MEKFIKFLKDNNAWENFQRALKNYHRDVKGYKEIVEKDRKLALLRAFSWYETEEGHKYWSKLDTKWLEENQSLKDQVLSNG